MAEREPEEQYNLRNGLIIGSGGSLGASLAIFAAFKLLNLASPSAVGPIDTRTSVEITISPIVFYMALCLGLTVWTLSRNAYLRRSSQAETPDMDTSFIQQQLETAFDEIESPPSWITGDQPSPTNKSSIGQPAPSSDFLR